MTRLPLIAVALMLAVVFAAVPSSRANMAPPFDIRLGIAIEKTPEGPRITSVQKRTQGDKAGLKVGDLILGIDRVYAKTMSDDDLSSFTNDTHAFPVELILARGTEIVMVTVAD